MDEEYREPQLTLKVLFLAGLGTKGKEKRFR